MSELASESMSQGDRERLPGSLRGGVMSELASESMSQGDRERLPGACEGES